MARSPLLIVICLLLGAITTIVLAMACASMSNPTGRPGVAQRPLQPGLNDITVTQRAFGHTRANRAVVDVVLNEHTGAVISCRWLARDDTVSRSLAGWPLHALRCENHGEVTIVLDEGQANFAMRTSRSGLQPVVGGWQLRDFTGGQMSTSWRAIPLQPMWPGLIADTLILGAMWWLMLAGAGIARGMLRRRRGMCPACGYDLRSGGLAHERCPECGMGLSQSGSNPCPLETVDNSRTELPRDE